MLACLGKGKWNHGEKMPHLFSSLLNHAFNVEMLVEPRVCVCARTRVTHKRMLVISIHEQPTMLRSWRMLPNVCKCIHVEDTSFDLQNVWSYICFQL